MLNKEFSKSLNLGIRLQILGNARFAFLLVCLSSFGASLVTFLISTENVPRWIALSVGIGWVIFLIIAILLREERQAKTVEAEAFKNHLSRERIDASINLTTRTINFSARSWRTITEELRNFSPSSTKVEKIRLKNNMLRQVFRDIRSVFEGDTRGIDTTNWPHNFFKLALYEPEPTPDNPSILRRTFFDYPEGVEPHEETETFDLQQHSRASVVMAFLQQTIIIIEDVKNENEKPPEVKRWINRRENQADEYESMLSAAIVTGTKGHPNRKCLGVLVIDTNRKHYFLEKREFEAFCGNLLNPIRTLLTFILVW